jgi:UDP-2-acetamido-3-amino-2,3-dideoxy-glucuronate N-acetyltransferase
MIHPCALVSSGTEIGEATSVWQFASVIRGARVGSRCTVAAGVLIDASEVGDDCKIGAGAQIHPGIKIWNGVFIGPGVIFCNDRWPTVDMDGFDGATLLSKEFVTTVVESGASVGAGSVILPGVILGVGCMIAAGSRVARTVPACHLHKADGSIVLIDGRKPERMRDPAWF